MSIRFSSFSSPVWPIRQMPTLRLGSLFDLQPPRIRTRYMIVSLAFTCHQLCTTSNNNRLDVRLCHEQGATNTAIATTSPLPRAAGLRPETDRLQTLKRRCPSATPVLALIGHILLTSCPPLLGCPLCLFTSPTLCNLYPSSSSRLAIIRRALYPFPSPRLWGLGLIHFRAALESTDPCH
jgi:hypothetical protein